LEDFIHIYKQRPKWLQSITPKKCIRRAKDIFASNLIGSIILGYNLQCKKQIKHAPKGDSAMVEEIKQRRHLSIVGFILVLGIVFYFSSFFIIRQNQDYGAFNEFELAFNDRASLFIIDMRQDVREPHNIKGVFEATNDRFLRAFDIFAKSQLNYFPSIKALEWIPRILHKDPDAMESLARQTLPQFEIRQRDSDGKMMPSEKRMNIVRSILSAR
jgi:hypothetical protein